MSDGATETATSTDASQLVTSKSDPTPELVTNGLSASQFHEVKKLINEYLNKLDQGDLKAKFPPTSAILFGVGVIALSAGLLVYAFIARDFKAPDKPEFLVPEMVAFLVHRVTIFVAFVSLLFTVYKISAYMVRQYYVLKKYQRLCVNRIAIFATVILNGGSVDASALSHFVADIPDNGDGLEYAMLHEKLIDTIRDLGTAFVSSAKKS